MDRTWRESHKLPDLANVSPRSGSRTPERDRRNNNNKPGATLVQAREILKWKVRIQNLLYSALAKFALNFKILLQLKKKKKKKKNDVIAIYSHSSNVTFRFVTA